MTILEKIQPFCSTKPDRKQLHNPIVYSGFIYATDGVTIIRAASDLPDTKLEGGPMKPPALDKLFRDNYGEYGRCGGPVWVPMPTLTDLPRPDICQSCAGHGTFFFYHTDGLRHQERCDECNGTGEVEPESARPPFLTPSQDLPSQSQGAKPAWFALKYLHRVKALGEVSIAVLHPAIALWFKTADGQFEGFVMPIRRE